MIEIKIGNEVDKEAWSEFVELHPDSNPFQTPEMYEVYLQSAGMSPNVIAVLVNKKINGLLVTNTISEPLSSYIVENLSKRAVIIGGPLITGRKTEIIGNLLLKEYERSIHDSALFTEIRNLKDCSVNNFFYDNGYSYNNHLNYLVDLTVGEEKLWANLSQSKRRYIRKALNQSKVETLVNKKDFLPFYRKLQSFYSQRVHKPLPDISHFESLIDILQPKGMLKIFSVEKNSSIQGGIICILYKDTIYEYYIFSERGKNIHASEICTWEPIKFGSINGYKVFDFMGAGKPEENYGVRKFKEGFGGKLVQYGRFKKHHFPIISKIATNIQPIYASLFSKLKND